MDDKFLYNLKGSILTPTELMFAEAIKRNLPEGYELSAQANLATFIDRLEGIETNFSGMLIFSLLTRNMHRFWL